MLLFDGKKKLNFIPSQTFTMLDDRSISEGTTQEILVFLFLNDKILKCFDGLLTDMIFTDLHKTFDTINHTVYRFF